MKIGIQNYIRMHVMLEAFRRKDEAFGGVFSLNHTKSTAFRCAE